MNGSRRVRCVLDRARAGLEACDVGRAITPRAHEGRAAPTAGHTARERRSTPRVYPRVCHMVCVCVSRGIRRAAWSGNRPGLPPRRGAARRHSPAGGAAQGADGVGRGEDAVAPHRVKSDHDERAVIHFGFRDFSQEMSPGSPHVRCTPTGRTCGEPDEIELTHIGVKLNGSRRVLVALDKVAERPASLPHRDDVVGVRQEALRTPAPAQEHASSTRPARGPCAHGQLAVSARPAHVQRAASTRSTHGQHTARTWSACGQLVVRLWSACGQLAVSVWSVCGQHTASITAAGQHTVPGRTASTPAWPRTPSAAHDPCMVAAPGTGAGRRQQRCRTSSSRRTPRRGPA